MAGFHIVVFAWRVPATNRGHRCKRNEKGRPADRPLRTWNL